ncbi:MAG: CBM20 domain-containing protein [Planctomycetota bacterium]
MTLLRSLTDKIFASGQQVNIIVKAPKATPAGEKLYLAGACPQLGRWSPTGRALRQTDVGVWEARLRVPVDQPLEFKVTRGSWDRVERHADGSDTGNHCVDPAMLEGQSVLHTVEGWSDQS